MNLFYVIERCHTPDLCLQLEKQRAKEEMDKKLLEQRAVFIEKAKTINLETLPEDKPRKSGKVRCYFKYNLHLNL